MSEDDTESDVDNEQDDIPSNEGTAEENKEPDFDTMDRDSKIEYLVTQVATWNDAVKVSDGDMKLASTVWKKVKAYRQMHADEIKSGKIQVKGEKQRIPKMAMERTLRGSLPMKGKVDDRLQAIYNYYRENEGYEGSLADFMNDFPIHAAKVMDGIEPAIIKSTVSDKTIFAVSKTGKGGHRRDDDGPADKSADAIESLEGDPMQQVLAVKLDGHKLDQELQRLKIQKMRGEVEGDTAKPPDDADKMEVPVDLGDGKVAMMKVTPFQWMMMENVRKSSTDSRVNPVIETTSFLKDVGLLGATEGGGEEMKELRQELRETRDKLVDSQLSNMSDVMLKEIGDLRDQIQYAQEHDDFDEYLKLKGKLKAMGVDPDDEKASMYVEQRKMTENVITEVRQQSSDFKDLLMPLAQAQAEVIKRQTIQQTPQQAPQQPQQTQEDWGKLYGGYLAKEEAEAKASEAQRKAAQAQGAK